MQSTAVPATDGSASGSPPRSATRERGPAKEFHIPSLDGVRAVAFLIVFASHTLTLARFVPGGFGVTIFFFLSGYLITTLLRLEEERTGSINLRQFYLRRVLRILPPMYIALALAWACSPIASIPVSPKTVVIQFLQFTNYHLAFHGTGHPIGTNVLWSLSVEEHFYLFFPLLYLGLRRFAEPTTRAAVLLLGCALVLAWRLVVTHVLRLGNEYSMFASDTRVDSLLFGCALALWKNPALPGPQLSPRVVWSSVIVAVPVMATTVVLGDATFRETFRYTLQGLALAPFFIAMIRFPSALPFRLLNTPLMKWIGVLSYALYLVHLPIIETLRLSTTWSPWMLAVTSFIASIATAAAIHRFVERPCAKLRKRLSRAPTAS